MLRNWIQENIILSISDLITGQQVRHYLKFMLQSKHWGRQQLDDFQNDRLRKLIEYAYQNVPYYHDVMIERGLTPADIQTKEDLHKLPILTKEIMRREGTERFLSRTMPRKEMLKKSTSGSTGQPFVFYVSRLSYSVNLAANLRGWYNFGWRLGDKYVKISQKNRTSFLKKIQDFVTGSLYVALNDLSDKNLHKVLTEIENYQPIVIRSYPDTLYILGKYRFEHKDEFTYRPKVITTTGNVLHDNERKLIEETFGCKIFDAYACEGNSNVFECTTHECYHSSEEYGITEILDENDNPITNGEGRLISTDLWNYAHPFIRYDVQDRVEVSTETCSCGRDHLRINCILGRDNEMLITPSGKKYVFHHFTVFFQPLTTPILNDSVEQFQIIQHLDDSITFRLVVNNRFTQSIENYIIDYWSKELQTPVNIEIVDRMPIRHNNKRQFIIVEKN